MSEGRRNIPDSSKIQVFVVPHLRVRIDGALLLSQPGAMRALDRRKAGGQVRMVANAHGINRLTPRWRASPGSMNCGFDPGKLWIS